MATVEPSVSEAPELADGLYQVECIAAEFKRVENDQFGNNDKVEISLKLLDVLDEEGKDIILKPRINRKWSEKATLYLWSVALGVDVDPGAPMDTDWLIGRKAQALVQTEKEGSWPRVKDLL